MRCRLPALLSWLVLIWLHVFAPSETVADESVSFRGDIAPILRENCLACHGPRKAEGGYRVDSYDRAVAPGESELAVVTPKDPDDSELYRRIASDDADERMPLEADPLPAVQVELVRRWIEEGAGYDADDVSAPLLSIMPPPEHPAAPEVYRNSLPVTALTFTPGGDRIVVGGYHELTIWDLKDGAPVRRFDNIGQRTYSLAFSPDGRRIAVGCGAPGRLGEARLLDFDTGEIVSVLKMSPDVVLDLAFDPSGDRLAVVGADGISSVFEVANGEEIRKITSHSDWISAVAWSDDGSKLATASRDKTAKVFDAVTGELLMTYAGHQKPVRGVVFHPDGEQVFTSGDDHKVHLWSLGDGKKKADIDCGEQIFKIRRADDSLLVPSADKSLRRFDTKSREQRHKYSGLADWAIASAYHHEGKLVACGGFDGTVHVWNSESGEPIIRFAAVPGAEP